MAISNEGLAIEIKNLSLQIADLKTVMANQAADYVRKEIFELRMRELDTKLAVLELDIANVRKDTRRANWRTHTLTAVFTATLVLLITYVFNSVVTRS
jgi:hypothetical protein